MWLWVFEYFTKWCGSRGYKPSQWRYFFCRISSKHLQLSCEKINLLPICLVMIARPAIKGGKTNFIWLLLKSQPVFFWYHLISLGITDCHYVYKLHKSTFYKSSSGQISIYICTLPTQFSLQPCSEGSPRRPCVHTPLLSQGSPWPAELPSTALHIKPSLWRGALQVLSTLDSFQKHLTRACIALLLYSDAVL